MSTNQILIRAQSLILNGTLMAETLTLLAAEFGSLTAMDAERIIHMYCQEQMLQAYLLRSNNDSEAS